VFKAVAIKAESVRLRHCVFGSNMSEAMATVHSFCGTVYAVHQMCLPQIDVCQPIFWLFPWTKVPQSNKIDAQTQLNFYVIFYICIYVISKFWDLLKFKCHETIQTIIFNNICLYKMLYILTLKGNHPSWINEKEDIQLKLSLLWMRSTSYNFIYCNCAVV